ncbi:MAG TPA: precorrin-6y C5,15-methyltransferase (decarboxylating) subunit CbiE [Stellaceae bacterium]|nr:precorrin-6y C5,15-methyltransferase (decarboxylating) subunit CbiE [Stellaceae bacterium]
MKRWLTIVGIGEEGLAGLSPAARTLIETAEILVGGARHLAMVLQGPAERQPWESPLRRSIGRIAGNRGRRVVVLASGDPMWYGVGVTLARRFAREEMTILPHLGVFSLAASRLGWPLAECTLLTLHGRPLDMLRLHLAPNRRILVLSEDGATPGAVAGLLTRLGWGASALEVLAHLGGEREEAFSAEARQWGERRVPDLNTIALLCRPQPGARILSRLPGLPDDAFEHDGQLTKRETRAATLSALAPLPGETLWDIGAGCGSIAIEWLRAGEGCRAFAIEKNPERAALIARNAAALGVPGLRIVAGAAPAALAGLPDPDAVFVGGGVGGGDLLAAAWERLLEGGRLVANVVTAEGEAQLLDWHARHGGMLTRLAASRAERAGVHHLWRSLATVTQLAATKPAWDGGLS